MWRWVGCFVVLCACNAPKWTPDARLIARERTADRIGVLWTDAPNATSYLVTLDGERTQEIAAPNVEAIFEDLEESHLYLIEVRATGWGGESTPLRVQARTRDGTPPEFPADAELSYALDRVATFSWPAATDTVGVIEYVLRDADDPTVTLDHVDADQTEFVFNESTPRRVAVVALDGAQNESRALVVEVDPAEAVAYEERRLEYHRQVASELSAEDIAAGRVPEGINPTLLRQLVDASALVPEQSSP